MKCLIFYAYNILVLQKWLQFDTGMTEYNICVIMYKFM